MQKRLAVVAALATAAWWVLIRNPAPEGRIVLSSYVKKDGECYRVDQYADGSAKSTKVAESYCA